MLFPPRALRLASGILLLLLATPTVHSFGGVNSLTPTSSDSVPRRPVRPPAGPRIRPFVTVSPRLEMASFQPRDGEGEGAGSSARRPLVLPSWSLAPAAADLAADAALALARSRGWAVTVCVSDAGGVPLVARRDDGGGGGGGESPPAFAASYEIAVGKARSAALFGRPTSALEGAANARGSEGGRTALLSAPFVVMGGGVPVKAGNGAVVGAVGVSGVKPDQDEMVAKAAVEALEGALPALPPNPTSRL